MNQALKQRLVGALVLVALGIIFLPSIFNGGRPQPGAQQGEIPPAPVVVTPEFQEPERSADFVAEPVQDPAALYGLEAESPAGISAPPPSTKPALDKKGLPQAWVLQVASFSESRKADELKKALQAKQYKAFTRTLTRDGKRIIRVMIGPEMDSNKLASIKKEVDREFKVKSIVVKFES